MAKKSARERRQKGVIEDVPVSARYDGQKRLMLQIFNRRDLYPTLLEDLEAVMDYNKKHSGARGAETIRRLVAARIEWLKQAAWGPFASQKGQPGGG